MPEEQQEYAIQLENNMYSNVDAALHFFDKYSGILTKDLGFKQSDSDPCIFFKLDQNGKLVIIISTYVDDSLIGGWKNWVKQFYQEFSKYLKIGRLGKLKKHLGVWWEWQVRTQRKST